MCNGDTTDIGLSKCTGNWSRQHLGSSDYQLHLSVINCARVKRHTLDTPNISIHTRADICSICIMSTCGVADFLLALGREASRRIGYTPSRHDTNGLYPESAW